MQDAATDAASDADDANKWRCGVGLGSCRLPVNQVLKNEEGDWCLNGNLEG